MTKQVGLGPFKSTEDKLARMLKMAAMASTETIKEAGLSAARQAAMTLTDETIERAKETARLMVKEATDAKRH